MARPWIIPRIFLEDDRAVLFCKTEMMLVSRAGASGRSSSSLSQAPSRPKSPKMFTTIRIRLSGFWSRGAGFRVEGLSRAHYGVERLLVLGL